MEGVNSFRKPSCSPLEFSDGAGGVHVVHNTVHVSATFFFSLLVSLRN
jgi:hypothetical protein